MISDIGLQFSFLLLSFPGFGIRLIWLNRMRLGMLLLFLYSSVRTDHKYCLSPSPRVESGNVG